MDIEGLGTLAFPLPDVQADALAAVASAAPYGRGEDASDDGFEIIEVSDGRQYITDWRTRDGEIADFGELPLLEGELLPAGALDDEVADEQRVTEATGNEGASFERAYHRAALVLWPEDRATEVLLQSGTRAAVTHLEQMLHRADLSRPEERERVLRIARTIMEQWEGAGQWNWRARHEESGLGRFLEAVARLDDTVLTTACLERVGLEYRAPGMHTGLVACLRHLPSRETRRLGGELMKAHASALPAECIHLLDGLTQAVSDPAVEVSIAGELLASLPREEKPRSRGDWFDEEDQPISTTLSGEHLATLLLALRRIGSDRRIASDFFLARSATAPAEPTDWIQPLPSGCQCAHCKALMKFAADPDAQVARFPLRKDLRHHLHRRLDEAGMDMTHETERKGRPYTLVCTKTRWSHERRLKQYQQDLAAMRFLRTYAPDTAQDSAARLTDALGNAP